MPETQAHPMRPPANETSAFFALANHVISTVHKKSVSLALAPHERAPAPHLRLCLSLGGADVFDDDERETYEGTIDAMAGDLITTFTQKFGSDPPTMKAFCELAATLGFGHLIARPDLYDAADIGATETLRGKPIPSAEVLRAAMGQASAPASTVELHTPRGSKLNDPDGLDLAEHAAELRAALGPGGGSLARQALSVINDYLLIEKMIEPFRRLDWVRGDTTYTTIADIIKRLESGSRNGLVQPDQPDETRPHGSLVLSPEALASIRDEVVGVVPGLAPPEGEAFGYRAMRRLISQLLYAISQAHKANATTATFRGVEFPRPPSLEERRAAAPAGMLSPARQIVVDADSGAQVLAEVDWLALWGILHSVRLGLLPRAPERGREPGHNCTVEELKIALKDLAHRALWATDTVDEEGVNAQPAAEMRAELEGARLAIAQSGIFEGADRLQPGHVLARTIILGAQGRLRGVGIGQGPSAELALLEAGRDAAQDFARAVELASGGARAAAERMAARVLGAKADARIFEGFAAKGRADETGAVAPA